ncbi:MAG TPA: PepSY domain-containing protein [Bacteroidia bacterium]|nr:hypothetical protein [Bacteroidia bacterium]HSH67090.1 PepSY domain-containing protein [Bacteroidia bacterium]
MKTIKSLITASIALALSSCATELKIVGDDVPTAVSSAFKAKYPNATNPEWEVEKEEGRLVYEAEFKIDGKSKEAYFKPDGTFLKEE